MTDFHKDPWRALISVFIHVVLGSAHICQPSGVWLPTLMYRCCDCLWLNPCPCQAHTHTTYGAVSVSCSSSIMPLSLGSPLENCLGAHRAVTPALPNVLQVRGTGGIKTWKAGNGNERSSQNVTACSRGNVGWNDPPHLFLKWVIRCSISWKAMTTNARIIILLYIKIYSQRSILFSCWSGWRWRSFNKLFIESVLS